MIDFGEQAVAAAGDYHEFGHPLEITHELASGHAAPGRADHARLGIAEPMPRLAQLVAASPVEAAIHDAYGHALGANSYNLLSAEFVNRDLASYLTPEFAGEYLDRYTSREPKPRMPLYHLVGALDPLTDADITYAHRRRPAGDAAGVDRLQRADAPEDQAQRRRPGVGRRSRGGRRARRRRGPGHARLHDAGTTRSTSTRSARTSSTCSTSWTR